MRIKLFFTVMLFLSGMAVQFAGAMEERKQRLELVVSPGRVTSIEPVDDNVISVLFGNQHKLYGSKWEYKTGKLFSGGGIESRYQKSAIHSAPITTLKVADDKTLFTASYDKQKDTSCIKATPLPDSIFIKTSDCKMGILIKKTDDVGAIEKYLKIVCASAYLSGKILEGQGQKQEIIVDITGEQLECARCYMGQPDSINRFGISQLCNLILADEELKIKIDNENSLRGDCVSALKATFDKCQTDDEKSLYITHVERLPENYKRTIALHIAKNFIDQSQDDKKYPAELLEYVYTGKDKMYPKRDRLYVSISRNDSKVVNIESTAEPKAYLSLKHVSAVQQVVISNGRDKFTFPVRVATLSNGRVTIWSCQEDGVSPSYYSEPLNSDDKEDDIVCIDITENGRFLAAVHKSGHVRIWDLESGFCYLVLKESFGFRDIMFDRVNNEQYIYIAGTYAFDENRKINLKSFFKRIELVEKLHVRSAYLVGRLAEKALLHESIVLTQAEYNELNSSEHKKDIESFFGPIVAEIKVEKLPEQTEDEKKDDKQTLGKFSSLVNLFTFNNFVKGSFLTIGAFSIIYFIVYSMNH